MDKKREITRADEIKGTRTFLTIFALFWNGIILFILAGEFSNLINSGPNGLLKLAFLIPFLMVGFGVAYLAMNPKLIAKMTQAQAQRNSGLPSMKEQAIADRTGSGHVILKPQVSAMGKLIGISCFAIFWNGIVSVFLFQLYKSFSRGHTDYFLAVFLIPFVLVGLGFLFGVFYFLLALLNPRPTLKLKSSRIMPGEKFDIAWQLSGSVDRIENMRVYLEGREEATYRRGTRTTTDTSIFAQIELLNTRGTSRMRKGSITASLPVDSMHSFDGNNNKIRWHICIHGEIPKWPDVKEEFEITVAPLELERVRRLS